MIQLVNKGNSLKGEKSMEDKIFQQFDALVRHKKQPSSRPQIQISKESEDEAQQLFSNIKSQSQNQQNISQKGQSAENNQNAGEQTPQNNQSEIKSILKKPEIDIKNSSNARSVRFADQIKGKQSKQQQGQDYVVIESGRKWNEKLSNPRKGKFDPLQKRLLIQSLSQQISIQNLNYDDIVKTMSEDDQKIPRNLHFWTKVCSVLPDRALVSSYKFLKRQLSTKNKGGEWTQEEVDQLEHLVKQHGTKWTLVAKEMHRTAENVRDKYRSIREEQYDPGEEQTVWKFQELVKYLRYLQKYSQVEFINQQLFDEIQRAAEHDLHELQQLKKRKYNSKNFIFHNNSIARRYLSRDFSRIRTDAVNWQKLSDRMGNKTVFDCRNKFVQLLQMEIYAAGSKQSIEQELVRFVSTQKPRAQNEIEWSKWRNEQVDRQEAVNRWMILKRHVQGRGTLSFQEILARLQEKYQRRD